MLNNLVEEKATSDPDLGQLQDLCFESAPTPQKSKCFCVLAFPLVISWSSTVRRGWIIEFMARVRIAKWELS